jgi:hypothetical protein
MEATTEAALAVTPAIPFLRRSTISATILLTFCCLTLPLAMLQLQSPAAAAQVLKGYFLFLGLPHFFITFTVYFQKQNRDFFRSSPTNVLIFWITPFGLLAFLAVWNSFDLISAAPVISMGIFMLIRIADFLHLSRQSFGVLQMFKGSWGARMTVADRRAENALMFLLAFLMFQTFAHDQRFDPSSVGVQVTTAAVLVLFARVLWSFVRELARGAGRQVAMPLSYLLVQVASMALAVWRTELYGAALAIHYVEYLLLMGPRCFKTPRSATAAPDRLLGGLLRWPLAFFAVLMALSLSRMLIVSLPDGGPVYRRMIIHMYDGLFVFHYFVEAFIWKFSWPYFRGALGPLYFPAKA